MKKYFSLLLLLILLIGCGEISPKGDLVVTDQTVEPFTSVELEGNFKVFFVKNNENLISIETTKNLTRNLKINSSNGTLKIVEKRPTKDADFYQVTLFVSQYPKEIKLSKGVEFTVSGDLKTDEFILTTQDESKFIGHIISRAAKLDLQGLSRANLAGESKDVQIKLKDTAQIIAPYWNIKDLSMSLSNQSYLEVHVKDSLKGDVMDTSKLLFYNDPIKAFKKASTARTENQILD